MAPVLVVAQTITRRLVATIWVIQMGGVWCCTALCSVATLYEAPSMSVKRACDWSVTAPRRAVHVSEARMGVVNGPEIAVLRCSDVSELTNQLHPRPRDDATIKLCSGLHLTWLSANTVYYI